jgi:hypothetical protein
LQSPAPDQAPQPAAVRYSRAIQKMHHCKAARQGLRAGMPLAYKEAKIFTAAYHTRLFFTNGLPAS